MEREKEKADHLSDIGIFPHLPAKKKVAARLRYVVAPRESVLMVHYWFLYKFHCRCKSRFSCYLSQRAETIRENCINHLKKDRDAALLLSFLWSCQVRLTICRRHHNDSLKSISPDFYYSFLHIFGFTNSAGEKKKSTHFLSVAVVSTHTS